MTRARARIYGKLVKGQYPALGVLTRKYAERIRRLIDEVCAEPYDLYDVETYVMREVSMRLLINQTEPIALANVLEARRKQRKAGRK